MVQTTSLDLERFWNDEPVNSKNIFWNSKMNHDFNWSRIIIKPVAGWILHRKIQLETQFQGQWKSLIFFAKILHLIISNYLG